MSKFSPVMVRKTKRIKELEARMEALLNEIAGLKWEIKRCEDKLKKWEEIH